MVSFRLLFLSLDSQNFFTPHFSPSILSRFRRAAATPTTWSSFPLPLQLRRLLALAALAPPPSPTPPFSDPYDTTYEPDPGLNQHDDPTNPLQTPATPPSAVYQLLGSDDHPSPPPASLPSRPLSSPKRPRRPASPHLTAEIETFIRTLREHCEPARDVVVANLETNPAKNGRRKAVSASSVVEELRQMELRAAQGRYERVEDVIAAVSACIRNQDETFRDVLGLLEERAHHLREESRKRKALAEAAERVAQLTVGILGARVGQGVDQDEEMEDGRDENEDDVEPSEDDPRDPKEDPKDAKEDANIDQSSKDPEPNPDPPTQLDVPIIPYVHNEADLNVWPTGVLTPVPQPCIPRLPVFPNTSTEQQPTDEPRQRENLVSIIGLENRIMKNAIGLMRIRRLREIGLAKLAVLTRRKTQQTEPVAQANGQAEDGKQGRAKVEDTLAEDKGMPTTFSQTSPRDARDGREEVCERAAAEELEIKNDPLAQMGGAARMQLQESRARVLGRSVCALMLANGGFSHTSVTALDILTDVLEHFVTQIGHKLVSCRENIDRETELQGTEDMPRAPSRDEYIEQLRIISSAGCRGGYPKIFNYVTSDLLRIEQSVRDAETRLRMQITKVNMLTAGTPNSASVAAVGTVSEREKEDNKAQKQSPEKKRDDKDKVSVEEIRLDDAAFTFGFLTDTVHLDVLGPIKVPRQLALQGSKRDLDAKEKGGVEGTKLAKTSPNMSPRGAQGSAVKLEV